MFKTHKTREPLLKEKIGNCFIKIKKDLLSGRLYKSKTQISEWEKVNIIHICIQHRTLQFSKSPCNKNVQKIWTHTSQNTAFFSYYKYSCTSFCVGIFICLVYISTIVVAGSYGSCLTFRETVKCVPQQLHHFKSALVMYERFQFFTN